MEAVQAIVEMARVDASLSTFLMVHNCLAMLTIGLLGSEEQKRDWLPRMASLDAIGCWALTEPSNGSDASALQTTAQWTGSAWRITGRKRWIGNGTFADTIVVWARSSQSGQVRTLATLRACPTAPSCRPCIPTQHVALAACACIAADARPRPQAPRLLAATAYAWRPLQRWLQWRAK
jgi:hypothetical protein